MKVRDLCSREVVTVEPLASLRTAAMLMRTHHVGALVAVVDMDGGSRPVGIITDRDIVVAVVALPGADADAIRVFDVMSARLAVAREGEGAFEALQTMSERGVRRLPVVADNGALRGIVSADDLLRVVAAELGNLSKALQRGAEREALERRLDLLAGRARAA